MAEVSEFPIGNNVFYIRHFEPFKAGRNLMILQRTLLAPILACVKPSETMDQEVLASVFSGFAGLLEKMDENQFDKLLKLLIDPAYIFVSIDQDEKVKLTEGNFNLTGLGVADLIELMAQVVRVNYEDFGRRAMILFGQAREKSRQLTPGSSGKVLNSN